MDFKKIKLNGRYLYKDNHYYFFNGGSGFSFKMKGESFSVSFESSPGGGYFYIILDKNYENKMKVGTSGLSQTYTFKDTRPHYVDIVKANESNDNVFKLLDFKVNGELLDYDFNYSYRIKVYGDSTIAGFGILEHNGYGSIDNSDSVRDFCFKALYELNAVFDLFSASGWGLAGSIYTSPNDVGIINFIDKVAVNKNDAWKDDSKYDLLIVSLGTNDNSYIQDNPLFKKQRIEEFKKAYKKLIDFELNKNPDLKILMVYGTLKEENVYYLIEETYEYLKLFYRNLFIHKFNGDNTAISNHAYVDAHDNMAEELKAVIKSIL